jgi:hypothetical protein
MVFQVADFHSYDFVDVWGGTREEANTKVLDFFESSHFKVRLLLASCACSGWVLFTIHTASVYQL